MAYTVLYILDWLKLACLPNVKNLCTVAFDFAYQPGEYIFLNYFL